MGRKQQKVRIASRRKMNAVSGAHRNSKTPPGIDISKFNEIKEELHKYKEMVDSANHGFVITDMKGNLLYVNDSFARMHGYNAGWLPGRNMKIFHNAEQLKYVRAVFDRLIKTGKGLNNEELWRKRRDGTVFPTLTNNWILRDKSGHPAMLCATMVDISELRKREAELAASRGTLEAMLNASGDLIAMLDRDGNLIDLNERMSDSLGLPRGKLIGRNGWDFIPPKLAASRRAMVEKAMVTGKPITFFDDGGRGRVFSNSCYPLKGPDGKVTGIVVFARDVTQQKKAEAEIEASKKTLETMLNASGELIGMIGRDTNFIDLNKQMAKALGQPRGKLIGRCAWDFMPPKVAAVRRARAETVIAAGKPITFFDEGVRGGIFSNSCYPLKSPDGKVTGIVVFARDITRQKQAEAELNHYREELFKLRRSAYLDLFSAIIGHQLSQPLTIINVLMEEMADELKSGSFEKGKTIKLLKTCLQETKAAGETIQKMREYSRQWIEGRMERFSPCDAIKEVVSSLELKARRAKIKIEVMSPKSLPTITGHRSAFEQIVYNITENAIEAADQKKWHRLVISAEKTDRHIELQFCDDCCGIPKENLGKIFEPFYSTKTHRGGKSLGLGLPIISRILTTMGGEIKVKSTAGKGTTFYVNWPLK